MKFHEPEVVELGEARDLIQESQFPGEDEGPVGARTKNIVAIYVSEE
jgi:hypothetical protein